MKQRFRWGLLAVAMMIQVIVFTNCSEPAPKEPLDIESKAEKATFAYDAHFDQLAYMSCSELPSKSFDQSSYFTFRAGAYRTGGLKMRDGYMGLVEKEFRNPDYQMEYLVASPINTKTRMQLSIRSRNNFQQPFTQNGSAEDGEDLYNFLADLGSMEMFQYLIDLPLGQRVRYMRNGQVTGLRFEGHLQFGDSTALAESVRNVLSSDGMLALTFLDGDVSKFQARSPGDLNVAIDPRQSVYGKGLVVNFRQPTPPSGQLFGNYPNYALRDVTELNLESRTDTTDIKSWACPTTMQFRIVRPGDDAQIPCNAEADPAVQSNDLKIVRRSLRTEDWYVDMVNRCIVPKKFNSRSCYGNLQTVQYNLAAQCTPGTNTQDCVHWASICYRTP